MLMTFHRDHCRHYALPNLSPNPVLSMNAAARIAISWIAIGLIGCKAETEPPSVVSFISFLESDSVGTMSERSLGVRCDTLVLASLGYGELGEGCWRRVADSLFYIYRGSDHQVLVRGKRVLVAGRRLDPLTDSLIAAMASHFGKGASCERYDPADPYYARLHIWHQGRRTLYLHKSVLNDSSALRPGITVEITDGNRSCAMEVTGPPARM